MHHVVVEQLPLEPVDCFTGLSCDLIQVNPDEKGAGDVVTLNPGFAALATLNACNLFEFAVKLLNFPSQPTRLLCRLRRFLSMIVGHDPIRAV